MESSLNPDDFDLALKKMEKANRLDELEPDLEDLIDRLFNFVCNIDQDMAKVRIRKDYTTGLLLRSKATRAIAKHAFLTQDFIIFLYCIAGAGAFESGSLAAILRQAELEEDSEVFLLEAQRLRGRKLEEFYNTALKMGKIMGPMSPEQRELFGDSLSPESLEKELNRNRQIAEQAATSLSNYLTQSQKSLKSLEPLSIANTSDILKTIQHIIACNKGRESALVLILQLPGKNLAVVFQRDVDSGGLKMNILPLARFSSEWFPKVVRNWVGASEVWKILSSPELKERILDQKKHSKESITMWVKDGVALLEYLYEYMMWPIEAFLKSHNIKHVVLIPDEHFHFLPLHSAGRWVNGCFKTFQDEFTVSYVSSLRQAYLLARRTGKLVLTNVRIIGDPRNDLLFSRCEASMVADYFKEADVLIGSEATAGRILGSGTPLRPDLIHFAGHGLNSFIVMDTLLIASDKEIDASDVIMSHPINPGGLCVMSSCESNLVSFIPTGVYSFCSLVDAWIGVGANHVVSTDWMINDIPTFLVMKRFYKEILAGKTPSSAIREATLGVRDSTDALIFSNPMDWGAFRVAGVC